MQRDERPTEPNFVGNRTEMGGRSRFIDGSRNDEDIESIASTTLTATERKTNESRKKVNDRNPWENQSDFDNATHFKKESSIAKKRCWEESIRKPEPGIEPRIGPQIEKFSNDEKLLLKEEKLVLKEKVLYKVDDRMFLLQMLMIATLCFSFVNFVTLMTVSHSITDTTRQLQSQMDAVISQPKQMFDKALDEIRQQSLEEVKTEIRQFSNELLFLSEYFFGNSKKVKYDGDGNPIDEIIKTNTVAKNVYCKMHPSGSLCNGE
jgi:hypothetical protein